MNNSVIKFLLFPIFLLLFSCGRHVSDNNSELNNNKEIKESLEKANRYLVETELEDIDNYVRRHGLKMIQTGSGLQYQITKVGSKDVIKYGDHLALTYELFSIDGTLIYTSVNDGIKQFVVGDGTVESGLDEAVRLMHDGDNAIVILPSHLAYGLLGDQKSIPPKSVLVYSIVISKVS